MVKKGASIKKTEDNRYPAVCNGRAKEVLMEVTESESLEEVIGGVAGARDAFVRRYRHLVRSAARRVAPKADDRAPEDIEMELWERVFEKDCALLRSYKGRGSFEGYLRCCLACRAMDIARSISRARRRSQSACESGLALDYRDAVASGISGEHCFERTLGASGLLPLLREAIRELPSEKQLFIQMLYYDNADADAVAAFFRFRKKSTVYSRKFRILAALRTAVLRKLKRLSKTV